jgi:hypothetical protein
MIFFRLREDDKIKEILRLFWNVFEDIFFKFYFLKKINFFYIFILF